MFDLAPLIKHRFFDANGAPLAGGFLYSYRAGTTTPLATYADKTGGTANTNPVLLDANGECNLWIADGDYKFMLADATNAPIWTVDHVQSLAAQIAAEVNVAGALGITSNLSDVEDPVMALVNLDISPFQYQKLHALTASQSATDLTNETFDALTLTSVVYEYEIQQAIGGYLFVVSSANATAGATYTNNAVTFTVVGTIASGLLLYSTSSGAPLPSGTLTKASGTGDATITFSKAIPQYAILATGDFSVHYENGVWVKYEGEGRGTAHGVTFSLTQATTIGQIQAAESGLGDGTIKLKRHFFFA